MTDVIEIDESSPNFSEGQVIQLEKLSEEDGVPKFGVKPRASSWVFDCPKNGHSYDPEMPPMMAQLADRAFGVRICVACGCPVYIPLNIQLSQLVNPQGENLIVEG
jgi:hypothetical protein